MVNSVTHELYRLLKVLDEMHIFYRLERDRPDTVRVDVTLVGKRVEIDVFEDGHIEYSRFLGDESVESGAAAVESLYARLCAEV